MVERLNYMVVEELWASRLLEALEDIKLTLEAASRGEYCCLRHGLPYVTPSLLAAQAFCEYRLDLALSRGELGKPKPSDARILVEALLEAKRFLPREPTPRIVLSTPLAAVVDGVAIVGRPHALIISGDRVEAIIVGKISSSPARLYDTDRIKLYSYALTAEEAGLRLDSEARLVLVASKSSRGLAELLRIVRENGYRPLRGENGYVHVLAHDPEAERKLIGYLLAYWKGEREPQMRRGGWCTKCPYRDYCFSSRSM